MIQQNWVPHPAGRCATLRRRTAGRGDLLMIQQNWVPIWAPYGHRVFVLAARVGYLGTQSVPPVRSLFIG
jgi:hypothetical protein